MSSPTPHSPCKSNDKPKKSPTITPKRFGRFFTPRTSLQKGAGLAVSRLVLGDGTNRRREKPRSAGKDASGDQVLERLSNVPQTKKRKQLCTPHSTPEQLPSFKNARQRSWSACTEAVIWDEHAALSKTAHEIFADENFSDSDVDEPCIAPKPLVKSSSRGALGAVLRRELDPFSKAFGSTRSSYAADWRCETANFFSHPDDTTVIRSAGMLGSIRPAVLPFCTASCNTNTLVAVGDEEGYIRMLESGRNEVSRLDKTYLSFRPHANAVIGLTFSSDDLLLATAAGDQTSRIIDMPTQSSIYTLAGHTASVKQVQFQPGSGNNIIATCGRDGSVQIWDLRCKGSDGPKNFNTVSLEGAGENHSNLPGTKVHGTWAQPVNSIYDAHIARNQHCAVVPGGRKYSQRSESPSKCESEPGGHNGNRRDISITSLAFLSESRPNHLITASDNNASVKLWDLRNTYNPRRGQAIPVSTTRQPESHVLGRQYGLNSIAVSSDGARLYTLCRDNNIYVYSTSHLILGSAPELDSSHQSQKDPRSRVRGREGLGPLYALRHPGLCTSSFYVKLAVRPASMNRSELLAVGSGNKCAVVFPTDERYFPDARLSDWEKVRLGEANRARLSEPMIPAFPTPTSTPNLPVTHHTDNMPIYSHGSCLVRAHSSEVTSVSWSSDGDLVTLSDDCRARVWREDAVAAREIRLSGTLEGQQWNSPNWEVGWAEADPMWDDAKRSAHWP
ncbi:hypothetical protein MMC13_007572 [Lambiella insularis]|nr:hypothetical protein [Lambiella insularis]